MGVEKLLPAKFAKIKSRQEAPQSIFSGGGRHFLSGGAQKLGCGPQKLHLVENLSPVTLLHQFQPGVPGRWKSIDSKCVRAARSFDEAQSIISLMGAMSGVLAYWRRSVRPGMIAHALQDVLGAFIRH